MKHEVRNVGKFPAPTPSSSSNYLLYISVESIKTLILSTLLYNKEFEPEDGVDAEYLPTFLTSCFTCPLPTEYYPTISISIMRLINNELLHYLVSFIIILKHITLER